MILLGQRSSSIRTGTSATVGETLHVWTLFNRRIVCTCGDFNCASLDRAGIATVGGVKIVQRAIQLGRDPEKDYRNESSQGLYRESGTE